MNEHSDAYTVEQFCDRHNISKAFLYMRWRVGDGPRFMLVGTKRLISREAATDWRRSMEAPADRPTAA